MHADRFLFNAEALICVMGRNFEEKCRQLKSCIEEQLIPLINNDYVLWELPYHENIGDLLIWKGELAFLRQLPYKRLGSCSFSTYEYKDISSNVVILLHGGGNFGDVWREPQNFRLQIVSKYPDNPIIIFPQTVWYHNAGTMKQDAEIMARHKNLTICARDKKSYEFLKTHFSANKILLVPDMAFCLPADWVRRFQVASNHKTLFLKRTDKELDTSYSALPFKEGEMEVSDWPTFERRHILYRIGGKLVYNPKYRKVADWYFRFIVMPYFVRKGLRFVSPYDYVYTTRLHVAISCVLLGKPFTLLDNSYGKNSSFYETWLADVDGIECMKSRNS